MTVLTRLQFSHSFRKPVVILMSVLLMSVGMTLAGCGGDEEKSKPAKKQTRSTAPAPVQAETIADLMQELNIDDRVDLPENFAPSSREERIQMLKFFDAWVRGDHDYVGSVLCPADAAQLAYMVREGQWDDVTGDAIEYIMLQTGPSPQGGTCILAIYEGADVMESAEAQLWAFQSDGGCQFMAIATPPGMVDRLSGEDLIAEWWKILEDEEAMWALDDSDQLADLSDDEEEEASSKASSGSGGSNRRQPGGGRRTPGGR